MVFSNHCLKSPFSNLTFQSRFPKRMRFLSRFRLKSPQKTRSFWEFCPRRWFSQITFSNHNFQIWLFRADFQKECGLGVDSGLISSKTTFLLRILLVKVVFSNHFLKSPFSNLTFQSRFPKRMWFLNKFTFLLRILLMKVVFSNHFLKSPFSNLDFSELISKKNVVFE